MHCVCRWAKARYWICWRSSGLPLREPYTKKCCRQPSKYLSDQNEDQMIGRKREAEKFPVTLFDGRTRGHQSSSWASISLARLCTTPRCATPPSLWPSLVLQRRADAVGNDDLSTRRDMRPSKLGHFQCCTEIMEGYTPIRILKGAVPRGYRGGSLGGGQDHKREIGIRVQLGIEPRGRSRI